MCPYFFMKISINARCGFKKILQIIKPTNSGDIHIGICPLRYTYICMYIYVHIYYYLCLYTGFRSMPAMDLRKTCKLLKPFLVGEGKKVEFEKTYTIMIDAVNDIDVVRTSIHIIRCIYM